MTVAGLAATFGSGAMTNSIDELESTDLILATGTNTTENHPVIGAKVKRAVRRHGTKLIVIDPREIDLVKYADIWLRQKPGTDVAVFNGLMKIAPTWDDIAWIAQQTSLPVILKGVLHPLDARLAMQHGVQGLIVSNHGGRVLDTGIPPLTALQLIRKAVPADFPLLYDGGVRRGSSILCPILWRTSLHCNAPCHTPFTTRSRTPKARSTSRTTASAWPR
mgnify:CR=1 FL=1